MRRISNQILISAIDSGETVHGALRSTKPLSQGYNKNATQDAWMPDWSEAGNTGTGKTDNRPVIYLTLMNGTNATVPSGWTTTPSTWNSVKWIYNQTQLVFDANQKSTNATVSVGGTSKPLFQRVIASWEVPAPTTQNPNATTTVQVPGLKILENIAQSGNLNNDVVSLEGNVEMSGELIGFSAGITIQLCELNANGYLGVISFANGKSTLSGDGDSTTAEAMLYKAGAMSGWTCKWKVNGTAVTEVDNPTAQTATPYAYRSDTSITPKRYDRLKISGDDTTGVLDIATLTCEFYVDGSLVFTAIESVDDISDEEYLFVFYTVSENQVKNDGSPVHLRKGQTVTWDMYVGKADNADEASRDTSFVKFEYQPRKADGTTMTYSNFSNSGAPMATQGKWDSSWCDVTLYNGSTSQSKGQFKVHFDDAKAAGRNIGGIIRASTN